MARTLIRTALAALALAPALVACSSHAPAATAPASTAPTSTATQTATRTATATTTATSTATSTATASVTRTATANPTSGGPASGAQSTALTQTYCIPTSKVCFSYPEGYQIGKDAPPQTGTGEYGHVADSTGKPVLYFSYTPVASVGGVEFNDPHDEQKVLRAQTTKARAIDGDSATIYASTLVVQDAQGFFPRQMLSNAKQLGAAGTFHSGAMVQGGAAPGEYIAFPGQMMLSFGSRAPGNQVPRHYASAAEAQQALNAVDDVAYAILGSTTTG